MKVLTILLINCFNSSDFPPGKKPLDWCTRMENSWRTTILDDFANPPVIHHDFNASDILLDEECNPIFSSGNSLNSSMSKH